MRELLSKLCNSDFPQLNEIRDTDKLRQTLQQYMTRDAAGSGLQILSCKIGKVYYKPGGNCRILLTANIQLKDYPEIGKQLLFGKLFRQAAKAKAIFGAIDRHKLVAPRFGPAVMHIPEWQMVLWAFPNDPWLPGLKVLANAQEILAMAKRSPHSFGLPNAPVAITAELKKYVPGMRCCYIFKMVMPAKANRSRSERAVFAKAYQGANGRQAYSTMRLIWNKSSKNHLDLLLPQPYSFDAKNQILWQEALSGQSLSKTAPRAMNLPEIAKEIGHRLAAFHNTPLTLTKEMTIEFEKSVMRRKTNAICATYPAYAAPCLAVMEKLERASSRLRTIDSTPIHASFKFSHIFSTDKGITFIDFDGANRGDPAYDLGRFIAHVYNMGAKEDITRSSAEKTIRNFCESYNQSAKAPVAQDNINWFTASHLLGSQVYKAVKRMNPEAAHRLWQVADQLCPQ